MSLDTPPDQHPIDLLLEWIAQARAAGARRPLAMALATATLDGTPSVRMVIARRIERAGITFYTDARSPKGRDLAANPRAARPRCGAGSRSHRRPCPTEALLNARSPPTPWRIRTRDLSRLLSLAIGWRLPKWSSGPKPTMRCTIACSSPGSAMIGASACCSRRTTNNTNFRYDIPRLRRGISYRNDGSVW